MRTGDGWLARLVFSAGMSGEQLAGLAAVAAGLGNGLMEVTARGSVQIRGLAEGARLGEAVAPLGLPLAQGLTVVTSPIAGLDPEERADPRPLAAELRGFGETLPLKVTALVDGGGTFALDAAPADVRLVSDAAGWHVGVGGTAATARWLGALDAEAAVSLALDLLGRMARRGCRGRDLDAVFAGERPVPRPAAEPVARFRLRGGCIARGVAFPFGVAESGVVAALARVAGGAALCPAPGRALLAVGLDAGADARFVGAAARLGFVTDPSDPRLAISACAGAPACASGRIAARGIAARIAAGHWPEARGVRLHVSGCAKRCAQPAGAAVTLVAEASGPRVTGDGVAAPPGLERALLEAARW